MPALAAAAPSGKADQAEQDRAEDVGWAGQLQAERLQCRTTRPWPRARALSGGAIRPSCRATASRRRPANRGAPRIVLDVRVQECGADFRARGDQTHLQCARRKARGVCASAENRGPDYPGPGCRQPPEPARLAAAAPLGRVIAARLGVARRCVWVGPAPGSSPFVSPLPLRSRCGRPCNDRRYLFAPSMWLKGAFAQVRAIDEAECVAIDITGDRHHRRVDVAVAGVERPRRRSSRNGLNAITALTCKRPAASSASRTCSPATVIRRVGAEGRTRQRPIWSSRAAATRRRRCSNGAVLR